MEYSCCVLSELETTDNMYSLMGDFNQSNSVDKPTVCLRSHGVKFGVAINDSQDYPVRRSESFSITVSYQ
jgi:hypothetical protein